LEFRRVLFRSRVPELDDLLLVSVAQVSEDGEVVVDEDGIRFAHLPCERESTLSAAGAPGSERIAEVELGIESALEHTVVNGFEVALHVRPSFRREQNVASVRGPPES